MTIESACKCKGCMALSICPKLELTAELAAVREERDRYKLALDGCPECNKQNPWHRKFADILTSDKFYPAVEEFLRKEVKDGKSKKSV